MKQKSRNFKKLLCTAFVAVLTIASTSEVFATDEEIETLPLISISMADANPMESLKEKIIENRSEEGLIDLDTVDIENSTMSVDYFETDRAGIIRVDASVSLASNDEDALAPISVSFSEPVLLKFVESENPELVLNNTVVNIREGDDFKPLEYIGYMDDGTGVQPVLSEEDDVDTSKPGYYTATYTCTNTLGKTTIRSLDVTVEKKPVRRGRTISLKECHIADDGSIESMFEAINAVRVANGLHPYALADELGQGAAAIRAQEASSYLSHYRPDGRYYQSVWDDLNIERESHEILVMCGPTIQTNLDWWMHSPGHARIILNPNYTTIALGNYGEMWCGEAY